MKDSALVFPPALVPVIRDRCVSCGRVVAEACDGVLEHLLTTVFYAGLDTYEGSQVPVRVVFVGGSEVDLILPAGHEAGAVPIYAWKTLRFHEIRPFTVAELVKLAVATSDEHVYVAVRLLDDGSLGVAGIAREGIGLDDDPFLKLVTARPGGISVRVGRDRLVEYERGMILTDGKNVVVSPGRLRSSLETAARGAGLDSETIPEYLSSVRELVHEMAAHGHGGILVIYNGDHPALGESASYRMVAGSSIASLLRLSKIIGQPANQIERTPEKITFGQVLHNAFVSESQRMVEEFGALTAIDGATLLNWELALVAFGAVLPVAAEVTVLDAATARSVDLGSRGTRHRASAVYARDNPGSAVFVASEDGGVSCMLRCPEESHVTMWQLGAYK